MSDWRDTLYQPTDQAPHDTRPDRRLYDGVLYSSVEAMEEAKKRAQEERSKRVQQAIAAKYAALGS